MTQRDHIQTLIEKYWQGETSLSEEQELKAYYENQTGQGTAEGCLLYTSPSPRDS